MLSFIGFILFKPITLLTLAVAVGLIILPYRIAWRSLILMICTFLMCEYLVPKAMDDIGGWSCELGVLVFRMHVAFLLSIIGVRYLFLKIRKNISPYIPKIYDQIFFGYIGVLFSVLILKYLAFIFAGMDDGYLVHVIVSIVFITLSVACFYKRKYLGHAVSAWFISITAFTGVSSALGMGYGLIVMNSAANKAYSHDFCISLGYRGRSMDSYQDLTLFTMDKSWDYHVALLIEKRGEVVPYHWSYFYMDFVPGIVNWSNDNRPDIYCDPVDD